MMTRQDDIAKKRNKEIVTYNLSSKAAAAKMLSKPQLSEKTKQDVMALTSLSSIAYTIWKRELVDASNYNITCLDGGRTMVKRKGHGESTSRVLNLLERCNCPVVFSFGAQCRHELAVKNHSSRQIGFQDIGKGKNLLSIIFQRPLILTIYYLKGLMEGLQMVMLESWEMTLSMRILQSFITSLGTTEEWTFGICFGCIQLKDNMDHPDPVVGLGY